MKIPYMMIGFALVFLILFLSESTLAETGKKTNIPALTVRPDDKRPDDQFQIQIFNRPLKIGGEFETKPSYEKDIRLGTREDDQFRSDQHFELELLYSLSDTTYLFLEGKLNHQKVLYSESESKTNQVEFQRGEMWIFLDGILGEHWGLRVGRQNIREKREWWWDENLDAVTLLYNDGPWKLEFGIAQEWMEISSKQNDIPPEDKHVFRFFTHAQWRWSKKQRLDFFFLTQKDHSSSPDLNQQMPKDEIDEVDANLTWLGLRAMGRWKMKSLGKLYYWLDTAYVDGKETIFDFDRVTENLRELDDITTGKVKGWAFDFGTTWETALPGRPSLTLGYAVGSGDANPNDKTDHAFRQTGLQDNNGRFRGVDRFRYYGELLQPELSNIAIKTLALGFPLLKNSSVEILYHRYQQLELQPGRLRNAEIKADVLGRDKDIGQEIDFVIGLEEWTHVEIELVTAFFQAGPAFGDPPADFAFLQIVKIDYNF